MSSQTTKPPTRQTTSGTWKPLEATEFEGLRRGVEALQFLQRAQHIGKASSANVLRVDGWGNHQNWNGKWKGKKNNQERIGHEGPDTTR